MDIHSATFNQYSTQSNVSPFAQTPHAGEQVKQTQQKSNEQVSSTEKSTHSPKEDETRKPLADEKAIKIAEQSLDEAELKKVSELKQRDIEVRAHEAAHLAAAGKYATGGASFEYKRGPDGKSYAVGGEVGIDTSPVPNDPEATLRKAQQIQAAAHAPASPSAQDRQVAAQAAAMASQARAEISQQSVEGETSTIKPENEQNKDAENKTELNAQSETETQKANNEYQSVANYTEDSITPLLQQIA